MRIAFAVCGILAATPAFADPNAFIDVSDPPIVTATVFGNTNLATSDCTLHERELSIGAEASTRLTSKPSMAISFVVLANAMFAGGVTSDRGWHIDERTRPLGLFGAAIDHVELDKLAGPSSAFEIVGYATGAHLIKQWTPIAELHAAAFGVAKDYELAIGNDLVTGIATALDDLERKTAERKVLIVIGDGADTNNENARESMLDFGTRARGDHIETYGISMKTELSPETTVLQDMIESARLVNGHDGIAPELASIAHRMSQREAFEFAADRLAWNGLRHELILTCPGGLHVEAPVVLPAWAPPPRRSLPLAKWLLLGALAVLLIALIARRRSR